MLALKKFSENIPKFASCGHKYIEENKLDKYYCSLTLQCTR